MNIIEALEVIRDQMFGLRTRDHFFLTRIDAMKVVQPILEAAAKVDKHHVADATDRWFEWTPEMKDLIDALPGENYPSETEAK